MMVRAPRTVRAAASRHTSAMAVISERTSSREAPPRSLAASRKSARCRNRRRPVRAPRPLMSASTSAIKRSRERSSRSVKRAASSGWANRKSAAAPEKPRSRAAGSNACPSTSRASRRSPTRESATRASSGSGAAARARPSDSGLVTSEDGEVAVDLERCHIRSVRQPLFALVANEPLEDMLTERLGHELRTLHLRHSVMQIVREGGDSGGASLLRGHGVDVVRGLCRRLHLLANAVKARRQDQRERQVGIAGGGGRTGFGAGRPLLFPGG